MSENIAATRIDIQGELGIFTAGALRLRLLDAIDACREVDVDLSQVSEVDSAGLQLLVAAKREAAERDKLVRFTGHSAPVLEILELCDLVGLLGDPVLIQSRT
jgi:anti-anti-sigma factor